jgi:transketolase
MRGIPGMQVFCPADEQELVEGMQVILDSPAPCYIRYNASRPAVHHVAPFEPGKAEVLSEGTDVTLLSYGFMLREVSDAAAILKKENLSVRLLNMRTLKPVDEHAILLSATGTRLLVPVEDHFVTGGLTTIIAEVLLKHQRTANVMPIALEERWFKPALLNDVLKYEGFTGGQIAEKVAARLRQIQ